ncbi:retrovirus-related Pol polyprotein from transposon 17.6 [Nephila pilipes]|uniref:Retrovirus-related Pol polyprotein from transposon 17.6 n=1 Tax=Nephila pilipes TaxID=299642 RepID=A0A8X6MX83_NEPPI|nr:retrovirus-related Pol polyprotein from transposon 17.6 [Nephila pilipes]
MRKSTPSYRQKKIFLVKQPPQDRKPNFQRGDKIKKEEPSEVVCYGCGTPSVIKPKCLSCKGKDQRNHGTFSNVILQSASLPSKQLATLEVTINGVMGTSCADTAETHSITEQIQESCDAVKSNVSQIAALLTVKETDNPDLSHADEFNHLTSIQQLELKDHLYQLREDEGTHLTAIQKKKLNELLFRCKNSFCLGREAAPFTEHYIDTQNHTPVSVPPYRVSPARKEIMKNEIDRLVKEGIIKPCESPYAAPVALIIKTNSTIPFCVDYRKLNTIPKTDSYPLPRIDDLLHDAKAQIHKGSQNTSSADH